MYTELVSSEQLDSIEVNEAGSHAGDISRLACQRFRRLFNELAMRDQRIRELEHQLLGIEEKGAC